MKQRAITQSHFDKHSCWKRRCIIAVLVTFFVLTIIMGRPLLHIAKTVWNDAEERQPLAKGFADDASRMNLTEVLAVWPVPNDDEAAEIQLAQLFQHAEKERLRISIAGARHSMGGHCLIPGGIMIDMTPFNKLQLDEKRNLVHIQAGAKWSDVIPYLDQRGKSVAIMQSNNSFTVGGSISVNCHGWQYGRPPISSSVESFRLMLADGKIVDCSRTENKELFSLALGGYGLFGVILDVELRVIPNEIYRLEQSIVPVQEALSTFDQMTEKSDLAMAYARMSIVPDHFLNEVIINVLYRDSSPVKSLSELQEPGFAEIRRSLFRGSSDSDYGKMLRWNAETKLQPHLQQQSYSRNQLLNEGVEVFENRSAVYTDILHEYFVPREGLVQFVKELRKIIPHHKQDLLNVTIRSVDTDEDTFLRYADQPMFAFVMLFHQPRSKDGDTQMQAMTVELIDAVLQAGGRYYLPYRLHATEKQFHNAYPQAKRFFTLKKIYDPQERFQNHFYLKYGLLQESVKPNEK